MNVLDVDLQHYGEGNNMPIFIDSRGSGEADLAKLLKEMHLAVEVRHIDSGDIVFGEVGIERKTLNDLTNSIYGANRHFWEQIKVLKNTYKNPFILIEGLIDWKDKFVAGVPMLLNHYLLSMDQVKVKVILQQQ